MVIGDAHSRVPTFGQAVHPDEPLPARFVVGLDLGQAHDHTALAIVQRVAPPSAEIEPDPEAPPSPPTPPAGEPCELHVRMLDRAPLGTPFPRIVDRVAGILCRRPLAGQSDLVVDAVGVGRPVVDMLRAAGLKPLAVTAMGGTRVTGNRFGMSVPKRDLVTALQITLQTSRLKIAAGLPGAEALLSELHDFRVRITAAGNDQYGTWREGAHDDLVFALALATWWTERISRRRPGATVTARSISTGSRDPRPGREFIDQLTERLLRGDIFPPGGRFPTAGW